MMWLLTEILAFVLAAALFGGLIGLGLARVGGKRRGAASEREHAALLERLASFEAAQKSLEAKAAARGAAEAAVRGELEGRLVEAEAAAEKFRARAEAAERRLRAADTPPDGSAPLIEAVVLSRSGAENAELARLNAAVEAAEAARGKAERDLHAAEAEGTRRAQEIGSLRAQLAAAERMRAKSEAELAIAQAHQMTRAAGADSIATPAEVPFLNGDKPTGLASPRGGRPDDLRRIRGIGSKNEGVLNSLGIYHYAQIAALTPANVDWLDAYFRFHGRIAREDWVGQAKALQAAGDKPGDKVHPDDAGA